MNRKAHLIYQDETRERLDAIEDGLLALETAAEVDPEAINSLFREAHSIKAGANLLGFRNIEALSHKLENVLDGFRTASAPPAPEVITVLLESVDMLRELASKGRISDQINIDPALTKLGQTLG